MLLLKPTSTKIKVMVAIVLRLSQYHFSRSINPHIDLTKRLEWYIIQHSFKRIPSSQVDMFTLYALGIVLQIFTLVSGVLLMYLIMFATGSYSRRK